MSSFPHALLLGILAALAPLAGEAAANPLEVGDPELGRLREVTFPSPSFGNVTLLVYTPPHYFDPGDGRRFPVIYWLHGSGANHLQMEQTLAALPVAGNSAAAKLDTLVATGEIPPLLMVAISAPGGNWTDALLPLVTEEVPAFVDASYRTVAKRSGRGIEGFSLGSQGLSIYATARPDLYASISLLGGAFLTSRWTDAAPALLRDGAEVYLTIGDADGFYPQTLSFDRQLTSLGIPHTLDVVPGAVHSNTQLYAARGVEVLRWHAGRFAATALLDAGADLYLQHSVPATATLIGQLFDPQGTLGTNPTFSWTEVDGPGTATIDNPGSLTTTVHLPALGNYHFRLEVQGQSSVADVVKVQLLDLGDNLLLHLPLDGDFGDASGNGHTGTAVGAPVAINGGRFGGAWTFDGIDDALTVADFPYGPAFSLSLWLKPADLSGSNYQYLFSHNGFDAVPSCNLYLPETSAVLLDPGTGEGPLGAAARLRLALRDSVGDLSGQAITADTPTLDNGRWHQAAIVVTPGSGHQIYYDGLKVGSGPNGGDAYNPSTVLTFATRSFTPADRYFQGALDEIRLYGRAVLPEEVSLLGKPDIANTAPLVAAGADRVSYLNAPLLLVGLAADATPNGQLTVSWSRVSGPGTATFSDPAAPETSVTFSRAGSYVLRLSADDGQLTGSDELAVTVIGENDPGLVAQWTFDEGSGATAADRAGLAHTGTLVGAPDWITPARIGSGAVHFNRLEPDVVTIDASPVLAFDPAADSFSVSAWLRLAPGRGGSLLARGEAATNQRALHFLVTDLGADGRSDLQAIVGGLANNNAQAQGPRFDDNSWHHVALVHNAASHNNQLYLDGAPLGAAAPSGNVQSAADLLIGARRAAGNTGTAEVFDGDLDDLRIYSRALAPAEVLLLFTGPAIPPCGPPTCLFGDGFEFGNTSAWVP